MLRSLTESAFQSYTNNMNNILLLIAQGWWDALASILFKTKKLEQNTYFQTEE